MSEEEIKVTAELTVRIDPEVARALGRLLFEGVQIPIAPPAPSENLPRLLSVEQAAEYLGLSKNALYGLRYTGGAPVAIRVGRRLRFRLEDLEAWLEENRSEDSRRY